MSNDLEALDASELGTKAYWDEYYKREDGNTRHNEPSDATANNTSLSELESWFDDVGAPEKVHDFLLSSDFPLFTQGSTRQNAILDLGTGNGSTLMSLAVEEDGIIQGARMVGVDYSEASIALARRLWAEIQEDGDNEGNGNTLEFHVFDIMRDTATSQPWWPPSSGAEDDDDDGNKSDGQGGFDLVLDKGTFDAISLSSETVDDGRKVYEVYPSKVLGMVKPGGYFLITSCNWTEDEVVQRFCSGNVDADEGRGTGARFEVFHKIKYRAYSFGGQQGQGVASVCFQRKG